MEEVLFDSLFEDIFRDELPQTEWAESASTSHSPDVKRQKDSIGYKSTGSSTTDEPATGDDSSVHNNTSEDEKLEHRKERNRRHARETRRRKKEHVENLKNELNALRIEKAQREACARNNEMLRAEIQDAWVQALQAVLALRASADTDPLRWLALLDEEAVLIHPITPYRSYRQGDVIENRIVLMGISDIMADSASLQVALCALCNEGIHGERGVRVTNSSCGTQAEQSTSTNAKVQVRFDVSREEMYFGSDGLMCPFEMKTLNLLALGLRCEVIKRGCLRVNFNVQSSIDAPSQSSRPLPKVKQIEMFFDPIAFWRQMQQAQGVCSAGEQPVNFPPPTLSAACGNMDLSVPGQATTGTCHQGAAAPPVVCNTLAQALRPSHEARVITEATRPFRITHVNEAWTQLCGFSADEACGETLRILQGEETDSAMVQELVNDCVEQKPTSMEVTNYDKQGRKFRNFLRVYPLCGDFGETTHLLGVLQEKAGNAMGDSANMQS